MRVKPTPPFISGVESSDPHVEKLRILLGPFSFGITPVEFFEKFLERRAPVNKHGYIYDGEW